MNYPTTQEIVDSLSPEKAAALLALPTPEHKDAPVPSIWPLENRDNDDPQESDGPSSDGLTEWNPRCSSPANVAYRVATPLGEQVIKILKERDA